MLPLSKCRLVVRVALTHLAVTTGRRSRSGVTSLVYSQYGDPGVVLTRQSSPPQGALKPDQVRVRMLASPINPADINTIQGVYPVKPQLPAVGGNEGVGEVTEVGSEVNKVKVGDWVIPDMPAVGTWTAQMIAKGNEVLVLDKTIGLEAAATIAVNPCSAYRMLHDYVRLQPGDTVIQNGANSAVGQAVIQIARNIEVSTINIVRDRPDLSQLVDKLKGLGADEVVSEEELRKGKLKDFFTSHPPAKLGLNCVGGKQGAQLFKYLAPESVLVTYGAMSKQPLAVPAGPLIFNDVSLRGFWMTQWNKQHRGSLERKQMIDYLCGLVKSNQLTPPICKLVPIDNYKEAIMKSMEGGSNTKYILTMN